MQEGVKMNEKQAREQILELVKDYCETYHNQKKEYEQGDRIPYASRVYDSEEMVNLVDSALEFWLTSGRYTAEFEKGLSEFLGVKYCALVNSGSSANLLAFMALTSPLLGERAIGRGDEVITVAAGFPTTVAPIVQYGAVPVFIDVTIPQYNLDVSMLEKALSDRTKAVMAAHTLGNPFDLKAVSVILCMAHLLNKDNLFVVEMKKIRFEKNMLMEILHYGVPSGIQNSMIGLANVVVQSQINRFGSLATAAAGVHSKIEGFAFLPILSFNMAGTTFVSQNLGAKQYKRARKGAAFSIIATVLLAEGIGILHYTFAPVLVGLFDNTPGVVALGVRQARTVTLFYFLLAFSHGVAAICRGAGKAFVSMGVMLSIWCIVRVAYIVTVMELTGDIGLIYWAYPLTWGISSVIYLIYYLKADWVHGFETG